MSTNAFISKYEVRIYAVLRIVAGFLFLWHGSQKLFSFPHAAYAIPSYQVFTAGPIEFIGGILIMIGLGTRWAAFICSGEMAFAYWIGHGTHTLLPLLNKGELAMIYCFLFLFISARGSGIFSIDHYLMKRKEQIHN
jgi:putative oxidoreductase